MNSPPKEWEMPLPINARRLCAKEPKLDRRAGVKHMDLLEFDRVEHTIGLVLRYRQDDLDGLIRQPQCVRRMMLAGVARALRTVDNRDAMDAELFRLV
jgi:hypothetical protein